MFCLKASLNVSVLVSVYYQEVLIMKTTHHIIVPFFLFILLGTSTVFAQQKKADKTVKCATMNLLEDEFKKDPAFKVRFLEQKASFLKKVRLRSGNSFAARGQGVINIPIVFHVVLNNPSVVTDEQIQAQLDTLNKDYAGLNGDSVRIPNYFKSLFGKSGIQFCLAKRTPDAQPTDGIDREATPHGSFDYGADMKHATMGGVDAWDPDKYLNIWVCDLSSGLLGFATFPNGSAADEQGVVIAYGSLPGGMETGYNAGKSLTHEVGHYFNLYHIWGDDNGACTGTDDVDDTPNQADNSTGTLTGMITDSCSSIAPGIMYQNYMDYTDDLCLVMFTNEQVTRMETALFDSRPSLLNSDGCQPTLLLHKDANLKAITQPSQRICTNHFTPIITLRNNGSDTLHSLVITAVVDNHSTTNYSWSGELAPQNKEDISLSELTISEGKHTLKIYSSLPNDSADGNTKNDTLFTTVQYNQAVSANITESFEGTAFPSAGWDIVNPDKNFTWEKTSSAAKTGQSSVLINNFDYNAIGQIDYLRLPEATIAGADSVFLSFQVAAAVYSNPNTSGNKWDTLQVLISTDCGNTYTSVYKKWDTSLITYKNAYTSAFVPNASQWRKDSIDISSFIPQGKILIAFANTNGYENNIYLDDINLRKVVINPNLKAQGFLVTPNPARNAIAVQFYPQPSNLKSVQLFNTLGQKMAEIVANGQASNYYSFNINQFASGMYIVRAIFSDKVLVKKIIKL